MRDKIQLLLNLTLLVAVVMATGIDGYGSKFYGSQHSTCVRIPEDLKLCYGIGYSEMILPNLLRHETLQEVKQQATSFVPLLRQGCHVHARIFLCSLFAPVCVKEHPTPIPPCRSLCRDVERSCAPVLREYQFDWPSMLNCSQFSEDGPCVNLNNTVSSVPTSRPTATSNREFIFQSFKHFIFLSK